MIFPFLPRKFRVIQNNLVQTSTLDTYIIKGRPFTDDYSTVYLDGKPICDDYWDLNDGHVICKMMGFAGAESISKYLTVPDDFIMDNVGCDGSEDDINDCYHLDEDNCGTSEGAGVTCNSTAITGIIIKKGGRGRYRFLTGLFRLRLGTGDLQCGGVRGAVFV